MTNYITVYELSTILLQYNYMAF